MRLLQLQDDGEFSLVEFVGNSIPAYAILSHTWGSKDEEVTYQDLQHRTGKRKGGYSKIAFCREQAAKDGLRYCWIDTCCIDKASSAELSEAITSMFRWYQNSAQCYVYLSDVSTSKRTTDYDEFSCTWESAFRTSRWFLRGWTLQELVAPRTVTFFSKEGMPLGDKSSLERLIYDITHIPVPALRNGCLDEFDIEHRMSWIGDRQTTREEDAAYSMLGILGVSMVPNYGEGKELAFKRLRRETREVLGHSFPRLDDDQKHMLMDSLRFEQFDVRHMTIKKAHVKTCKWLLDNPEYLAWLDSTKLATHHGFIWIKGKPGTGKSTLMKFVLANAHRKMKDKIILSFFFNARGDDMEKSTIGTYRSLLLQLFGQLPALQRVFESLGLLVSDISAEYQWKIESLENLLEQVIQNLKGSSVFCFIDALDECDEQQIRDMVSFFERLGELSISSGAEFRVCFTSRHYPNITVEKGLDLVLEGQEGHNQDITNYLESELKIGKSKIAQHIRVELQEKASGVFMWIVLVVGILNKEHDRGRIHALRRRLQEIPKDLHELFRNILIRDSRNQEDLVLCIQWVLFAKEPLSPEQLYFAILSGIEPDALSEWDDTEITKDDIKRFIIDSSKGLTDITTSKQPKVQFIHESVRDFLLKENGLGKIWPEYEVDLQGRSHERLKGCCLAYMNWGASLAPHLSDDSSKASSRSDTANFREVVTQVAPFLPYAVQYVLRHADIAAERGVSQATFIQNFPLHQWIKLDNLFEKHEIRRHTNNMSLIYALGEHNMPNLIRAHTPIPSCLEVGEERYGPALFAAMSTGSDEAVRQFLEVLSRDRWEASVPQKAYTQYCEDRDTQTVFRRNFKFFKSKSVLSYLVELGSAPILALVLDTSILDMDLRKKEGQTLFYQASERGKEAVAKLLLEKGVDVNAQGGFYCNALQAASAKGREAVVKLLINAGANVNAQGGHYSNALYAASSGGYEQIVKLLLEKGANVNAQGRHYGNALQQASFGGHEQIVKLLLKKGANVNAQGGFYGNALQAALAGGHEQIVKLLLEKGAEVNAQGGHFGNVLQAASYKGHEQIVKLLLKKGAKVNAQGGSYGNALQAASAEGHEQIIKLLLEKGAKVNAQGGHFGNALQAASAMGHEQIVKLLLEKGVDINAQGGLFDNALQAASANRREVVVKMLRAKGAK
jgi:ankyrin repeat protein